MKNVESKIVHENVRFAVKKIYDRDEEGNQYERFLVDTVDAVAILPITKSGKVVFAKERRVGAKNQEIINIPAGKIDKGENPAEAAIRELKEETGYDAKGLKLLTTFYTSVGYSNEKIYLYLAEGLEKQGKQDLDESERIETLQINIEEVMQMFSNGEFVDASTQMAILWYKNIKNNKEDFTMKKYEKIAQNFRGIVNKKDEAKEYVIKKDDKVAAACIDMVNDFVYTGPLQNPLAEKIIPNLINLFEEFAKQGKPTVSINEAHTKDSLEFKYGFPEHGVIGTRGADIIDELKHIPFNNFYYKDCMNGFVINDVKEWIDKNPDITTLIVTGVCVDICIMQFVLTLRSYCNQIGRELDIVIAMDCVETYDAPNHNRDIFYHMALEFMVQQASAVIVKNIVFE